MASSTSRHILSTAANLLGFCMFVITSFHITDQAEKSVIDDFIAGVAFLLGLSCFLSFTSIRSKNERSTEKMENIADYLFLLALVGILLIILLISFHIIN